MCLEARQESYDTIGMCTTIVPQMPTQVVSEETYDETAINRVVHPLSIRRTFDIAHEKPTICDAGHPLKVSSTLDRRSCNVTHTLV